MKYRTLKSKAAWCIATLGLASQALTPIAWGQDISSRVEALEIQRTQSGNAPAFKISGQINEVAMAWDDGIASGVLTATNIYSSTRTTFSGSSQATSGIRAGFFIELEYREDGTSTVTADNPDGNERFNGLIPRTRLAYGFVETEALGRVSVGQLSPTTNSLSYYKLWTIIVHTSPDVLYNTSFAVNGKGGRTGLAWRDLASGLDSPRGDYIGYASPKIRGFQFSADYGTDGADMALTYDGKFGDFEISAAVGLFHTDENAKATDIRLSGLVKHTPSGFYLHVAHSERDFDAANRKTATLTYGHVGIVQPWTSFGDTTVFLEAGLYTNIRAGPGILAPVQLGNNAILASETSRLGTGIMQSFSDTALEIYVLAQRYEAVIELNGGAKGERETALKPWDAIIAGSRIKF